MSDSKKACFLSTNHDDTDARVVHKESVSLSKAGYDVTYLTPFGEHRTEEGVKIRVPNFAKDNTISTLPGGFSRIVFAVLLFYEAVTKEDYDVYHLHDPELLPIGFLFHFFVDGQFIYDAHEDARQAIKHKQWVPNLITPLLSKMLAVNDHLLTDSYDGIIAASDDIAERYEHHNNVVSVTNYPQKKWAELDYSRGSSETIQLVYCGLLSENRGIIQIIEATKQLPEEYDVILKLGGKYESDEFQTKVENASEGSSRIELVGWLPTLQDVIELYYESDIGLMCFQPEAQNLVNGAYRSNKLFQYMTAGIPIIVSDIGNWPEVVEDNNCGLTVRPNPEGIASGIECLIDNPDRRRKYGKNGRSAAINKYTWKEQESKLLDFYAKLLD